MCDQPIHILCVEDNDAEICLLREMLRQASDSCFQLDHVVRLGDAFAILEEQHIDLVLLDLTLPDSRGLDTFVRLHERAPETPIVVFSNIDDERLAVSAVQAGAQDYLVKGQVTSPLLIRAIRYAIERHRLQMEVRSLSLIDELTGLYNRRGFTTLADHTLKAAPRMSEDLVLIYSDMDDLKSINDTYGHPEGDRALVCMADIFRETFRESDIIARLSGDEYAVLAKLVWPETVDVVIGRLNANLDRWNQRADCPYQLAVSTGVVRYDPNLPYSVEELLARADVLMYEQKRRKTGTAAR